MKVEAVLLTGGGSRRMGSDKAKILVDGRPLGEVLAQELASVTGRVTVLGQEPLEGYAFLADQKAQAGPLSALRSFRPTADFVFVCACDLPRFNRTVVTSLQDFMGDHDAVIPSVEGRLQPLCALYRAEAFALVPSGAQSMTAWIEMLRVKTVTEDDLEELGVPLLAVLGANTPGEWSSLS
ncbi:MAG: molybdenum cofactor guanylyltransferase [Armatimonadetes bacterium]|nr:molybdenum cofactor guanylyltransferase [Armatimonadota bacterium]